MGFDWKAIFFNIIITLTDVPEPFRFLPHPVVFEVLAGERVQDFLKRLENQGLTSIREATLVADSYDFTSYPFVPLQFSGLQKLEGLFVPGAYRLYLPSADGAANARRIFDTLLEQTTRRFDRMRTVEGLSPYEQVILASVVEKEAAFQTQRREVAGTFWNRVRAYQRDGLARLESCATVEYVLGYHRPFLRRSDIDAVAHSPYNTYRHPGLMPTPISFVSDEALEAVMNPMPTDYYFLVMDWLAGRVRFNVHYAEHRRDVEYVIKKIQRRYGSLVFRRMDGYFYNYFSTTGRGVSWQGVEND